MSAALFLRYSGHRQPTNHCGCWSRRAYNPTDNHRGLDLAANISVAGAPIRRRGLDTHVLAITHPPIEFPAMKNGPPPALRATSLAQSAQEYWENDSGGLEECPNPTRSSATSLTPFPPPMVVVVAPSLDDAFEGANSSKTRSHWSEEAPKPCTKSTDGAEGSWLPPIAYRTSQPCQRRYLCSMAPGRRAGNLDERDADNESKRLERDRMEGCWEKGRGTVELGERKTCEESVIG